MGYAETVVSGKIDGTINGDIIFEPSDLFMGRHNVSTCSSICTGDEGKIPIRILNHGREKVQLYPNETLGTVTKIDNNNVKIVQPDKETGKINYRDASEPKIDHLSQLEQHKLSDLLNVYKNVLACDDNDLGHTSVIQHTIPLENDKPLKQRPYHSPIALRQEYSKQIKSMLQNNVIRPSSSPWTSPVVLVKKKDSTYRFCVDFRKLNNVTRKDTYPLPRIDDMLDRLHNAQFFTTLDLQSGYWQIPIKEEDKEKTAFSTGDGLYEFNVMPFGLTGAPATFQRCMNYLLMDVDHTMVYIDDIIIFSSNFDQHLKDIEKVLKILQKSGLKLKPSKCEWAKHEVIFLGHVVSSVGMKPDPANVEKVRNFPTPKSVKEIQRFIGLASYYRRFIKNFAFIAAPLHKLTKKGTEFIWSEIHQSSFDKLKELLISPPILRFPDMSKSFILMTDASGYAVGAVLGQKDESEKDHVIAYASRGLKPHEKNYSTIEKELLAIVFGTKQFKHYIWSRKILLLTDHQPLQWLKGHADPTSRLVRWMLQLQEFDIEFKHRSGKSNANADCLSRIEYNDDENNVKSNSVHNTDVNFINQDESLISSMMIINNDFSVTKFKKLPNLTNNIDMRTEQDKDEKLKEIMRKLADRDNKQNGIEAQYQIKDGVLKYNLGGNLLYVVPEHQRQLLLIQYHDGILGGHLSPRKTLSRLKIKYFWPSIIEDTKKWCKTCKICLTRKGTSKPIKVPLTPIPSPVAPMEMTAMDILGPFKESIDGNKYILVFSDYFTRWPEAYAIPNQTAETIAQIFVEKIVFRYGVPKKLLTDQGANFTGNVLKSVNDFFQILKLQTTPYHPQTDGLVERFNRTLANMLSTYTNSTQTDWDRYIPPCLFAYRSTVHASTGQTPFYLMYLRHPNIPIDLEFPIPTSHYMETPDYVTVMIERLGKVWEQAGLQLKHQQEQYKEQYDKKSKEHEIKVGDKVMVSTPLTTKGHSTKLYRPFKGPYDVADVNKTNVRLNKPKSKIPIVVHANRCRLVPQEETKNRYPLRSRNKDSSKTNVIAMLSMKKSEKNMMYTLFELNDKWYKALIDTGSVQSLVNVNCLTMAQRLMLIPTTSKYYTIEGQEISTLGKAQVTLFIGSNEINIELVILKSCIVNLLFGMDLIGQLLEKDKKWLRNSVFAKISIEILQKFTKSDNHIEPNEERLESDGTNAVIFSTNGKRLKVLIDKSVEKSIIASNFLSNSQIQSIEDGNPDINEETFEMGTVVVTLVVMTINRVETITLEMIVVRYSIIDCVIGNDVIEKMIEYYPEGSGDFFLEQQNLVCMINNDDENAIAMNTLDSNCIIKIQHISPKTIVDNNEQLIVILDGNTFFDINAYLILKDTRKMYLKPVYNDGQTFVFDLPEYTLNYTVEGVVRLENTYNYDEVPIRLLSLHNERKVKSDYEENIENRVQMLTLLIPESNNVSNDDEQISEEIVHHDDQMEIEGVPGNQRHNRVLSPINFSPSERTIGNRLIADRNDRVSTKIFSEIARIGHDYAFGKSASDLFDRIERQLPVVFTLQDDVGDTPLNNAILKGKLIEAEHILEIINRDCHWALNIQNTSGHTALILATACAMPASFIVKLLTAGIQFDHYDDVGKSAITYAVEYKQHEALDILLQYAKINKLEKLLKRKESNYFTYLQLAVMNNYEKAVEMFLNLKDENEKYMIDVNEPSLLNKRTALQIAIERDIDIKIIKLLLERPDVKINKNLVNYVKQRQRVDIITLLNAKERKNLQSKLIGMVNMSEEMLFLTIQIGERPIKALIDTGAVTSIIPIKLLNENQIQNMKVSTENFQTIDGRSLEVKGTTRINISYEGIQYEVKMAVVEKCCVDCVLGLNAISKIKVTVFEDQEGKKMKDNFENQITVKDPLRKKETESKNSTQNIFKLLSKVFIVIGILLLLFIEQTNTIKSELIKLDPRVKIIPYVLIGKNYITFCKPELNISYIFIECETTRIIMQLYKLHYCESCNDLLENKEYGFRIMEFRDMLVKLREVTLRFKTKNIDKEIDTNKKMLNLTSNIKVTVNIKPTFVKFCLNPKNDDIVVIQCKFHNITFKQQECKICKEMCNICLEIINSSKTFAINYYKNSENSKHFVNQTLINVHDETKNLITKETIIFNMTIVPYDENILFKREQEELEELEVTCKDEHGMHIIDKFKLNNNQHEEYCIGLKSEHLYNVTISIIKDIFDNETGHIKFFKVETKEFLIRTSTNNSTEIMPQINSTTLVPKTLTYENIPKLPHNTKFRNHYITNLKNDTEIYFNFKGKIKNITFFNRTFKIKVNDHNDHKIDHRAVQLTLLVGIVIISVVAGMVILSIINEIYIQKSYPDDDVIQEYQYTPIERNIIYFNDIELIPSTTDGSMEGNHYESTFV